jgi:predicted amidohydrolase YtcJ
MVADAFKKNLRIITQFNSDAAINAYFKALCLAANQYAKINCRTLTIHAQELREDQLDSMKVLSIIPPFLSMYTFYGGD